MSNETGGQKLDAWRASQGIKKGWLADKIGVNDSTLTRWVIGDVIPQRTARLAIELVTGGAVPTSVWECKQ